MNRILLRAAYAALLLCAFCVPTLRAQDDAVAARLREHLNYLCSDQLAGRYPGTAGNKLAAEYIATKLQAAGCKPLSTSFYQEFSIPFSVSMTGDNSAFFDIIVPKVGVPADALRPVRRTWKLGSDFTPLGFSASKSVSGNVVFCGYGVSNKEKNYDDYTGVDVKGKIAIILTGDMNTTNLVNKFKISTNTLRNRAINAREHGAIGVVFVHPQGDSSEILMPLRFESRAIVDDMPIIHVRRSIVTPIFPKDRQLIQEEEQIIKTKQPRSYEIPNTKMTLTVNLKIEEAMISNVVGYIAGTDPQKNNQMIVVGAHYDHLGMGDEHSLYDGGDAKIHYGADDNASGTAGVLELAAAIGAKPLPNPVLFIAFNAEERGLLGSAFYTKNPVAPLENVACMINMDMIGRLKDNKLNIQGIGTSTKWKPLIDEVNKEFSYVISTTESGLGPSDHSSFYAKQKPVLFFFTGLHSDYHRPSDTPDKINYAGEAGVLRFVEATMRRIGDMIEPVDFVKTTAADAQQSGSTRFRVTFGVIPDYGDHPKGLRITGTREGTPAEKGGLKADDIITKFGATVVKNIHDLTYALGQYKPGDLVKVTVLRGAREDKEMTLDVTLEEKK